MDVFRNTFGKGSFIKLTNLFDGRKKNTFDQREQFAMDLLMGLCSKPKRVPSKYFYDDRGSQLFQEITRQDDYYLTKVEHQILTSAQTQLAKIINKKEIDIIELGAGDGHKTKIIVDGFLNQGCRVNFFPIDISSEAMGLLKENLQEADQLSIHGIVSDYIEGLRYVRDHSDHQILALFLGSNIGNFDRVSNQTFMRMLWKSLGHDDYILTGFDLKKDVELLISAYNDKKGITKAFNLNLLKRINTELGGTFDIDQFFHFGTYNPVMGAMESYLVSAIEQDVYIEELERSFHFKAFEPIHLEYSFKFLESDIAFLAQETGFEITKNFTDQRKHFVDSLWRVKKHV